MPTTVTVAAAPLLPPLRAVRFAAAPHPDHPVLGSVLFDVRRARSPSWPPTGTAWPSPSVATEGVAGRRWPRPSGCTSSTHHRAGRGADRAEITLGAAAVAARVGGRVEGTLRRRLPRLPQAAPTDLEMVPVDTAALRTALVAAPTRAIPHPDGGECEAAALIVWDGAVVVGPSTGRRAGSG